MSGLYDSPVGALDPKSMMLMQMGMGLMRGPSMTPISFGQSLGQAGQQGLQAFQQTQQANQQQQLFAMKMEEEKRQAAERQKREAVLAELAKDPRFAGMGPLLSVDPKAAIERAFPKQEWEKVEVAGEDGKPVVKWVQKGGTQAVPIGQKYEKPETAADASGVRKFVTGPQAGSVVPGFDTPKAPEGFKVGDGGRLEPIPEYWQQKRDVARAGKTDVVVSPDNLGLKPKDRFDMEGKLRDDFRGNPTVKAADEMDSAFRLIETARNRPSPANDLAMATKYMKILDPTSVVRESELALAMNATGLVDKVRNYAEMVATGKKLNPNQREDFYQSAKAINAAFQKERGSIAERFTQNASQYNLTPENVVGSPKASKGKPEKDPQVDDWISRAMKRNMVSRSVAIKEGMRLGKVPEGYE
jgi:hypothetical protein